MIEPHDVGPVAVDDQARDAVRHDLEQDPAEDEGGDAPVSPQARTTTAIVTSTGSTGTSPIIEPT